MQAIICRYHGPTDTRGSRIYARCSAGSTSIGYPHELSSGHDTHKAAADALMAKLGWDKEGWDLVGGALPNQDWVFCLIRRGLPEPLLSEAKRLEALAWQVQPEHRPAGFASAANDLRATIEAGGN